MKNLLESQSLNDFIYNHLDPASFKEILFSMNTNSLLLIMTISILLFVLIGITAFLSRLSNIALIGLSFLSLIILVFSETIIFSGSFDDTISTKKINEIKSNIYIEKRTNKYPLKKTL